MKYFYFDYAATTPVDKRVAAKMMAYLTKEGDFGNPSSQHVYGQSARAAVETAREQVASLIHAEASEIIWTSGATESNNLALKGAAHLYQRKGKHIITVRTEHKAVLDPCMHLEKEGYQVTYLTPESNGRLNIQHLIDAVRTDTILVSVMYVNNETGIFQDIQTISQLLNERGILFHVDAAQAPGKVQINVTQIPIDLLSLSGHKAYGPKGVGALYLRKRPRVRVEPLIHGGGHEQGMRSGTLAVHQIVGMGEAFALIRDESEEEIKRIDGLREKLLSGLAHFKNVTLNSDPIYSVPQIINVRFKNMISDAILIQMPEIAASTASACQGKGTEGSYVLRAMGLTEEEARSSIRFSLGRFTIEEDVNYLLASLKRVFGKS